MGLDSNAQVRTKKVNQGGQGRSSEVFSPEISQLLDEKWNEVGLLSSIIITYLTSKLFASHTGIASYSDLRAKLSIVQTQSVSQYR